MARVHSGLQNKILLFLVPNHARPPEFVPQKLDEGKLYKTPLNFIEKTEGRVFFTLKPTQPYIYICYMYIITDVSCGYSTQFFFEGNTK